MYIIIDTPDESIAIILDGKILVALEGGDPAESVIGDVKATGTRASYSLCTIDNNVEYR